MKLLSFGQPNKYIVFPFLMPFFYCLRSYSTQLLQRNNFSTYHPFTISFFMYISEMFAGTLELISYYCFEKKKNNLRFSKSRKTNLVHVVQIKHNKKKSGFIMLIIACVALVDGLVMSGVLMTSLANPFLSYVEYQIKITQIFFTSFFSFKFLGYPLFRHHYLSIALIFIGISIVSYKNFTVFGVDVLLMVLWDLLFFLCWSTLEVTEKYLMERKGVSPYRLLFFEGFSGCVIYIPIFYILSLIPCSDLGFCEPTNSIENIIDTFGIIFTNVYTYQFMLLYLVSSAGFNLFTMLTKRYFIPSNQCVCDNITSLIWWLGMVATGANTEDIWYNSLIGYSLAFIGCLIFNEILIFHFWKFDENTKEQINKRGLKEVRMSMRMIEETDQDQDQNNLHEIEEY